MRYGAGSDEWKDAGGNIAFPLGECDHFRSLLGIYVQVSDSGDAMLKETVEAWVRWLPTTSLAVFMHGRWEWPIFESIHFLGLSLLIGAIGLFDFRLPGFGRPTPPSSFPPPPPPRPPP